MNIRLLVLFLGAVSLAGQVCWSRLAAAVVGGTFAAWAITLSGAMAGLSLGAALAGAFRFRRPVAVVVACAVALAAMPVLLLEVGRLEGMPATRAVLTALLLATAHLPFGAFLPAIAAGRRADLRGLYALSATGAVAGAILAGEFLPSVMALDHLGCLLGVLTLASAGLARRSPAAADGEGSAGSGPVPRALIFAAFALGAFGLVSESLWLRILGFYWESNTRCFAFVTAATVGGLSAGAWAARRLLPGRTMAAVAMGVSAVALAAASAASPLAVHAAGATERIAVTALLVGLPAAASGAAFVMLLGLLGGSRALGFLSAANSAGAAAGPLVLLAGGPWVSWPPQLLLLVAAGTAALAGAVAGRRAGLTGLAGAAVLGLWAVTAAPAAPVLPDYHPAVRAPADFDTVTMPYLRPSLDSTVAVTRDTRTGMEILWIDRGFQGDTSPLGRRIPERLGTLPCELLGRPARNAMVIGLGTGVTLSAIVDSGAASAEVAELSEGVIEANRTLLAEINGRILDHPAVRVRRGDGRPLLLDAPAPFDLIVTDMVFPTVLGAGNLFSREFYDLARRRLAADGLFVHWVPCFLLSPEDLSAVVRAFLDVFPDGSAWIGYFGPSRLLLGLAGGRVHPSLSPATAGRRALGPSELRSLAGGVSPIRDADPRLETRSRESGDGRFGIANLKRVAALMEGDPARRAWLRFAEAEMTEDRDRATALYREASLAAPGATDAEFLLSTLAYDQCLEAARAASERRDADLMLSHLRRAAMFRSHGAGNLVLADVLAGRGRLEEALAELKMATAKSPRSADAQLKLALVARELGDHATARRAFDAAAALREH